MTTDFWLTDAADPEETVGDLLTYAELLNTPQLAGLYIYVLRNGPVAIETVKDDLAVPHSTAYKYVGELEERGILTRHEDETPTRISVEPIHLPSTPITETSSRRPCSSRPTADSSTPKTFG